MPLHARPEVESLPACPHGGIDFREMEGMGVDPAGIIDFSVSSNPYGPPAGIGVALRDVAFSVYPDSECTVLRRALAERLGLSLNNIVAGNGSMEILRLAALAFLSPGDKALVPRPTFGEYAVAARIMGAEVRRLDLPEERGFRLRTAEMTERIRQIRPRMVFLCNPNNPTGQYLNRDDILSILGACDDTLLVLDEAYAAFAADPWISDDLASKPNVLLVRSMTKDYALAGLRLGYGVACPEIIRALSKVRPPWNVNVLAQAAGVAALSAREYVQTCCKRLVRSKDTLLQGLSRLGLTVVPSEANFVLVKVGSAPLVRRLLLERGMLVRDCTSLGLPQYIRIGVRPAADIRRLLDVLGEVVCR